MTATLVLVKKDGRQQGIDLKTGVTTIGRQPDCDIRISKMLVSRKHCRIINKGQDTVVQDLGSANGTYLNSKKIMESVIKAGDHLSVGPVTFLVQVDGQPNMADSTSRHNPQKQPAHAQQTAPTSSRASEETVPAQHGVLNDSAILAEIDPLVDLDDSDIV